MTAGSGDSDGRVRVAYFDDQLLFREALASLLEESGAVSVVHSSRHGVEDLRSVLDIPVSTLLIALDAQTNDPMSTVRDARHLVPELPMCALVAADRLDRAREAIAAGCKGVVSTGATLNLLVAALESLALGQAYVDPMLGGRLLAKTAGKVGTYKDNGKSETRDDFIPVSAAPAAHRESDH
jgi:DNA-binding NarL/FixJ family response regulator